MGKCWSRFSTIMDNCLPIFGVSESTNPSPHVSSISSSAPPIETSLPASADPMHPSASMEPSLSTSGEPSSAPPMEPSLPTSGDPGPSSAPVDAIDSIRGMCEKIDPLVLMDPLVKFIENQTSREAGSSSSEGSLAPVPEGIKLAAATIDTISKQAEEFSESDAVKEMGRITLKVLEGMGDLHRVFVGVCLAAFAAERYTSVGCSGNECKELFLKTLQLAKDVKVYGERMSKNPANELQKSYEKGMLCDAVVTIVEGAVISCDDLNRGQGSR